RWSRRPRRPLALRLPASSSGPEGAPIDPGLHLPLDLCLRADRANSRRDRVAQRWARFSAHVYRSADLDWGAIDFQTPAFDLTARLKFRVEPHGSSRNRPSMPLPLT